MPRTLYSDLSVAYHRNPSVHIDETASIAAFDSAAYPLAHLILLLDAIAARGPDEFTRSLAGRESLRLQHAAENIEIAAARLRAAEDDDAPSVARSVILTGAVEPDRSAA